MRIRAGKTLIISAPSSAKVKRKPVKKWVAVFAALAVLLLAGVALILWQFTYPSKIAPKAVTLKIDFDLHKFDEVMANSAARRIKRCIDQKNSVVDMTSLDKTSDVLNEDIDPMKGAGFVREVLINNGDIDDQGLKVLADLPITKLRLRNCQLKSLQPLAHHLQLSDLDLQGNPLDSEGIKNIGTIENLDSLNLTSTPIRDADLKSLLPLKHLQSLEIANCPGIHESAIREFEKEAHLTVRTRPSDPDLQYGIAERLRVKGKYAEAATQFERCSELVKAQETPDKEYLSNVIKKIGDCLMRSGRFEEALKSYEEAGKIYTASKPEPADTAAELTALASNYERWCLADPRNQNSLKKAIADRKQADKALALAGAKEADNRLLNLLAIISDAIAAGDIDLLSTEYAQLDVFEISKSLQLQMKDAVSAELRHNTASLKKAIALRQAAEPLFERFSQSRAHLELSLQNEVYLAADLFAVGDGKAGTDAIEKALKHNLQNVPLLAPTASVFEEAGDYWLKNGNANLADGFYVKAKEQFTQALQIKDSARIEKKLAALNKA